MVLGRFWFFPFVPRHDDVVDHERGVWGGVASLVGRRARLVWVVTALALTGAALFTTQLDADGLTTAESFTTDVDSVKGQDVLARHYPAGSGVPVNVIGDQADADRLLDVVADVDGVADARLVTDAPAAGGDPAAPTAPAGPPKVVDGKVLVEAVLTEASDSPRAEATVLDLRSAVTRSAPTCSSAAAPRSSTTSRPSRHGTPG